ncbi:MAG: ATP-binding protein [Spirochaetaceae bacterium]|jgi:predicted ATPase|nr:ATP-binding protein [Spirochaetaceae bacterium]
MLKEIYIDNFRRFINQRIEFSETMLIKGRNGTGKTTLIELIRRLKRFIVNNDNTGHVNELFTSEDVPRWLSGDYGQVLSHIEIKLQKAGIEYVYKLKIQLSQKDEKVRIYSEQLAINDELVYVSGIDDDNVHVRTDDGRDFVYGFDWHHSGLLISARVSKKIRTFLDEVDHRIHAFVLEPDTILEDDNQSEALAFTGHNFSQWYSKMLTRDIESASDVLKSYREFLPNCKRVFLDNNNEFTIEETGLEKSLFDIRFSELSTGQKKLCIYYAIFKLFPENSTFIFDEFENHLSPNELQPLYDMIQTQQDERDNQVILVSHHDKTINWYHESSLEFSLSGLPAHVKVDRAGDNGDVDDFFQVVQNHTAPYRM